jgi:hypothetical protein
VVDGVPQGGCGLFFFLQRYVRHRLWLLLSIGFSGEAFEQDALVLTIYMT